MRKLKKSLSVLLAVIMVLSMFTIIPVVSAETLDEVVFIDEDGGAHTAECVTKITSGSTELSYGYYAVTEDTEINSRITCTGTVHLILCNNATLTAHKGITVSGEFNRLTIWQQAATNNAKAGKLIINQVDNSFAGIGGENGGSGDNITISGGNITVTGGYYAAGIGGGKNGDGNNITINGGTVTATGKDYAAAIGGGDNGSGNNIAINGGNVKANKGYDGTGVGGGKYGGTGSITLSWLKYADSIYASSYNGTVTLEKVFSADQAYLSSGVLSDNSVIANKTLIPAAITYLDENGAEQLMQPDCYTDITSNTTTLSTGWYIVPEEVEHNSRLTVSGDVKLILCNDATLNTHRGITVSKGNSLTIFREKPADGRETGKLINDTTLQDNAGIGGGLLYPNCGNVTINGGIITVEGGGYAAAIGGGKSGDGGTITINGGTVTAAGGDNAAGIGGGWQTGGKIIINGGTVTATGGQDGAGIGSGYNAGGSNIIINGGTVTAAGGRGGAGIGGGVSGKNAGNITISGGTVTATGGQYAAGIGTGNVTGTYTGSVTLKWTEQIMHTMSVYANSCNVSITLENAFKDGNDTFYAAGAYDTDIIGEKTLTPAFFDVTWKNFDGTILETDEAEYGKPPTYYGITPVKPADVLHSYAFSGWTPEVVPLITDTTYTAAFKPVDGCFSGHSLTLDGDIGVNFYAKLSDAQLTSGAVVDFAWTVGGEEKTHTVTLTANNLTDNGYKATCPVAVAEMTCKVNATLTIGGVQYDTDTYSVKRYADTILSNDYKTKYLAANHTEEEYNKLAALVKAMLIYGAKAQTWFDRNLDDLADKGLDYTLAEVTPEMISPSARDMESGLDAYGLKYEGSTIVYLSKTSLRHYYTITDQAKFDLVKDSVMFDAEPVDYHTKNDQIYFEVTDIGAADLDTPYPLQIGTSIYSYTVLDYVRECIKAKYTPYQTMLLVFATYWYNQAANAYFG